MFKAYFDNGQLKVEGIYNSGKKQCLWTHYYQSGIIRAILNFHMGLLEGKSYWYHPNGSVGWEENYSKGLPDGKFLYFDESGQLRIKKVYEKGTEVSYIFDGKEMKKN